MSKQAILFLIDAGHSMQEQMDGNPSSTCLSFAIQCCCTILQQKLLTNSSHQLGLMLFGDNQSDNQLSTLTLQPIQKPTLDFLRKFYQMKVSKLNNSLNGGDIPSAIYSAVSLLSKKQKHIKRLFLFTNGKGIPTITPYLKQYIQSNSIRTNIIPINYLSRYNTQQQQAFATPQQQLNATILLSLVQSQTVEIFPAALATALTNQFRKGQTNPRALYKGALELAPNLQIEVCTYKAIRREKLRSLGQYDASKAFDPYVRQREVVLDVNYVLKDDQLKQPIEEYINAYQYGPHLVPISEILEKGTKILEDKNFRLLGFVQRDKIPREAYVSEVDIVVPIGNVESKKLFTAFIYSMMSLKKYAVCRYVARSMKNGVVPKMVVLIPQRNATEEMLYLVEIPTVEDVREYHFNSLKKSTEGQRNVVRGMVRDMMMEENVEDIFNPTIHYLHQVLIHRVCNQEGGQVPKMSKRIRRSINLEEQAYVRCNIAAMKQQFKFHVKEFIKREDSHVVRWRELLQMEGKERSNQSTEQCFGEQLKSFQQKQSQLFDKNDAIRSFRSLIGNNSRDLVGYALDQMKQHIRGKEGLMAENEYNRGGKSSEDKQIHELCVELRKACVSEKQQEFWDVFLQEGSRYLKELAKANGLGYLLKDNTDMFAAKQLHHMDYEDLD